jgi:cystathionine gamma-synthase
METIDHFSLGHTIIQSPHSVCVSLPTMADVIGYETGSEQTMAQIQSGYPRFVRNPLILKLAEHVKKELGLKGYVYFLNTERSARQMIKWVGDGRYVDEYSACPAVEMPQEKEVLLQAKLFLQHTGCGISSRRAEDLLTSYGTPEEVRAEAPEAHIKDVLHQLYGTGSVDDIFLCNGGMNAFYTAFQAAGAIQRKEGRKVWVQLGWLYVDSTRILEKFLEKDEELVTIYDVSDTDAIENSLQPYKGQIAGIVAEVPSNPMVHTPNLEALKAIAKDHGAMLLLDPTLVSPHNVNILHWTDLHINSLTKYAASKGDVIMGAVAVNPRSKWYTELRELVDFYRDAPYERDLARMAFEIDDYEKVIQTINANTVTVAQFLKKHPNVERIHWVYSEETGRHFTRIAKGETATGSIISFSLKIPLERFYDRVKLVKSPSFGLEFTLLCPFLYLSNYDMVNNEEGRDRLRILGIDPELVRLSVGMENPKKIIQALADALDD